MVTRFCNRKTAGSSTHKAPTFRVIPKLANVKTAISRSAAQKPFINFITSINFSTPC
jgi:hypothetical protein